MMLLFLFLFAAVKTAATWIWREDTMRKSENFTVFHYAKEEMRSVRAAEASNTVARKGAMRLCRQH